MSAKEPTPETEGAPASLGGAGSDLQEEATLASLPPDTVQESMDAVHPAIAPAPGPVLAGAAVAPPPPADLPAVPPAPAALTAVVADPRGQGVADVEPGLKGPSATVPGAPVTLPEPIAPLGAAPAPVDDSPAGKVARAREAGAKWAATSPSKRIAAVRKVRARILQQAEKIAETLREEIGKPIEEGALSEVLPNADLVTYWCEVIEEFIEAVPVELNGSDYPGKRGRVRQDPRGVVALITPWNYPIAIPLRTLVPALLVGNAVVWKPSEVAPKSSRLVASFFEGLLPKDVLTVLEGGPEAGQALVDAEVDVVVFTGSVRTGKNIAVRCAERLIPTSLELGGKDAAIVLADANLERTARGVVWGAFTNHGQNCASIERVYVERPIAEAFTKRVVELTKALTSADLGRMTTAAQHRIVTAHVADARARGAEVLTGGTGDEATLAFEPTVLKLTQDHAKLPIMTEESFGPLLPIVVVDDVEAAIRATNDSPFGLTTSVWTKRVKRARALVPRLKSGVVTINNHAFTAALPAAPWTGMGASGPGITNSPHALASLVRVRFELEDTSKRKDVWWYPYTPTLRRLVFAMAKLRGGAGFFGKVGAFFGVLVNGPKRLLGR